MKVYKIVEVEDSIRVPPGKLGKDLEDAIFETIQERFEGVFDPDLGIVLNVESIEEVMDGKVVPEDGAVFYPTKFKLLVYYPEEYEVTLGEVVDITEFGVFVRIGPIDGMIHISQIMNDYVSYDKKNSILVGRESKKTLKEGDLVRARIISVSFGKESKIGLTMRQPGLGAIHWIEREKAKKESTNQQKSDQEKK